MGLVRGRYIGSRRRLPNFGGSGDAEIMRDSPRNNNPAYAQTDPMLFDFNRRNARSRKGEGKRLTTDWHLPNQHRVNRSLPLSRGRRDLMHSCYARER